LTYKETFKMFQNDRIRTGYTNFNVGMYFCVPDTFEKFHHIENGHKMARVSTSCWFTNLPVKKHNDFLDLYKHYSPNDYLKYDNYDAINVDKYTDIPCDYDGVMGVPITFLDKYNPDQFEIIGCHEPAISVETLRKKEGFKEYKSRQIIVRGVLCQKSYHRLFIRKKQ